MKRLYVRNFHKYQHYKGETRQRPPWVKLHRSLLEDEQMMSLHPTTRYIALGLVLLASESPPSGESREVVASEKEVSRRLGVSLNQTRVAIKSLLDINFLASSPLAGRKRKGSLDTDRERDKEPKAVVVALPQNGHPRATALGLEYQEMP